MNKKKGFTLVELLVVIAILAILAGVSIIGYTSFIKKSHVSNDNTLVGQLNHYLKAVEVLQDVETVSQAREALLEDGIDLAKLKTSTEGYHFMLR